MHTLDDVSSKGKFERFVRNQIVIKRLSWSNPNDSLLFDFVVVSH